MSSRPWLYVIVAVMAGLPVHRARADVVDDLVQSLEDPSDKVRVASAQSLGKLGPTARYTLSLTTLTDASHAATADLVRLVHDGLARSLLKKGGVALAGGDRRVPPLARHLASDPSSLVRAVCAMALGKIQDPSAVPALQAALHDGSSDVKRQAQAALASFEKAFLIDGSITQLKISGAGSDGELDCEVKVLIATVPGKSIRSWVTEDASVGVTPSSPSDVQSAKHDCLGALGDPLADDVMKYVDMQ